MQHFEWLTPQYVMTYFTLKDYLIVVQQANLYYNDDRRRKSDKEQKNEWDSERCAILAVQTLFFWSSQNASVAPTHSLNLLQKRTETNTLHSPKAPLPNMVRKKSLECTSRDNQYAGDFEIEVKWLQKLFLWGPVCLLIDCLLSPACHCSVSCDFHSRCSVVQVSFRMFCRLLQMWVHR